MNILVTGGTGFVGANLVAACVARGESVRVLRRASSSLRALEGLPVRYIEGDVLDRGALEQAVEGCDCVFHVAAISSYWRSRAEQVLRVNIEGTRLVMDAALRAGVPRVVHTSSAAAVGIAENGIANEHTPFDALSRSFTYAASKHEAEAVVRDAVGRGLNAVMVNPAVVIGARDHYLNSSNIVLAYSSGRIPVVPPGGVCVADADAVVAGHLLAAERGTPGERYILGGENLSYQQITAQIAEIAGVRPPRLVLPAPLLRGVAPLVDTFNRLNPRPPQISGEQIRLSQVNFFFDSGKAVRELGYPLLPFCGAAQKALDWYRQHGYG